MKSRLAILCLAPLLLGGCSVRLPIDEAVAVAVSNDEVAALNAQWKPSTPGRWFEVRARLARDAVKKIARWELYTHMRVEDCRTGDLVGLASSVGIEGTDGDFEQTRKQLEANEHRQSFLIAEPVFSQPAGLLMRFVFG